MSCVSTVTCFSLWFSGVSVSHVANLKSWVFLGCRLGLCDCSGVLSFSLRVDFALLSPARVLHQTVNIGIMRRLWEKMIIWISAFMITIYPPFACFCSIPPSSALQRNVSCNLNYAEATSPHGSELLVGLSDNTVLRVVNVALTLAKWCCSQVLTLVRFARRLG
jgi:hypothetical protein